MPRDNRCMYMAHVVFMSVVVTATVLCSVCGAVTVECCVAVLRGCVWYVCCYVRKKALLQCLCNY